MTNSGKPKRRSHQASRHQPPPAIKVMVPKQSQRPRKNSPSAEANLPADAVPIANVPIANVRIAPTPASPVMIEPEAAPGGEMLAASRPRRRWRLPTSLRFWAFAALTTTIGIGGLSIALLLKLPALPNCPSIFWPTASARLRFYCADLAANKQTVDDLLEAIALINSLPADHPLRPEIDGQIETWATDILNLAAAAFNDGELDEAIATARRIPANTSAHNLVEDRIKQWQDIWQTADSLYQGAQKALTAQDLQKAFTLAVQLLDVDNEYWRTTKYRELNGLIAMYREDGGKLARARSLIDRGGKENLLEAVKIIEEIESKSPLYAEADKVMAELGQKMIDFASAALDRQDWEGALDVLRQIPERAKLQAQVQDFRDLAEAQRQAWGGTVADLEAAIVQAQKLAANRPLYDRAQSLIGRWRLEIEDVNYLERARQYAQSGTLGDLTAAIAEAAMIGQGRPRRAEARRLIADWTQRVEDMQDRPRLDQAEQLAIPGDMTSLQAAISEASQIRSGRSLYPEARARIRDWTAQVQEMQDRPILDRARQLALSGNLPAAIQTVESIASGRALSREAQTDLRDWRTQVQGQTQLQQAYQAASSNTIAGLVSSIRIASQVSANSSARPEADRLIDASSQALLQTAQAQAQLDLSSAIDIAENIPSRSSAYDSAQSLIQEWRSRQAPAVPSSPSF